MTDKPEEDGQIYVLGLIENLRDDLRAFDGAKDKLYYRIETALRELANPNLHDVNLCNGIQD